MALSPHLTELLNHARATAKRSGHSKTEPIHLLATLLREQPDLCAKFVDDSASTAVAEALRRVPRSAAQTTDSDRALELLASAATVEALVPALVEETRALLSASASTPIAAPEASAEGDQQEQPEGLDTTLPVALAELLVADDDGRETVPRERPVAAIVELLSRSTPRVPILVAKPGAGRTAIIEALRRHVADPAFRGPLKEARVYRLRAERVIGAGRVDALRRALSWLYLQADQSPQRIVLCIDDLEVLAALGGNGADIATLGLVRSLVDDGRIAVVLTIASEYFGRLELHDRELVDELERVDVDDPTADLIGQIVALEATRLENVHGVSCPEPLLALAAASAGTGSNRSHPALAVERLDRACVRALLRGAAEVAAEDFEDASSTPTEIAELLRRDELVARLTERVVAQDSAVQQLVSRLVMTRRGLDLAPERPDGVFLFAGPTGVGKTALARALAHELFGGEDALIAIDMSEYVHDWAISRLIGPQPGYVGSTEPEQWLTTRVRARPHCVLLLDEIEKAHPLVWNVFLQVFDAGRLTDSRGEIADFSNVIVIMTSNLGAHVHAERSPLGFGSTGASRRSKDEDVKDAIRNALSPELVNRLDGILVFQPLEADAILLIARKTIVEALGNLRRLGFEVTADESAVRLIADEGFDSRYGARQLRRTIEQRLLEPLVSEHEPGNYVVRADDGALFFATAAEALVD